MVNLLQDELTMFSKSRNNIKFSLTKNYIVQAVTDALGLSVNDIKGSCRKRKLVYARMIIAYMLREYESYTHPEIAEVLNKDRTTAIYYTDTYHVVKKERDFIRLLAKVDDYING